MQCDICGLGYDEHTPEDKRIHQTTHNYFIEHQYRYGKNVLLDYKDLIAFESSSWEAYEGLETMSLKEKVVTVERYLFIKFNESMRANSRSDYKHPDFKGYAAMRMHYKDDFTRIFCKGDEQIYNALLQRYGTDPGNEVRGYVPEGSKYWRYGNKTERWGFNSKMVDTI